MRPISEQDLAFLDRFDLDPSALGEFEWGGFGAAPQLRKRWQENGLLDPKESVLMLAAGDAAAGIVSWRTVNRGGPDGVCAEIGVALLPVHRGKGIGTQAHRLLTAYVLAHTTVERLEALTDAENVAEQRVLERVGFRREGLLRHALWQNAGWRDLVIYALLRSE